MGVVRQSFTKVGGRITYIIYQIWLSKNSLVFDTEVVPAYRMLERAICLVTNQSTIILMMLAYLLMAWISGTPIQPRQQPGRFFSFSGNPSSKIVKINFDDSLGVL